jgi:hypothetical protein
MSDDPNEVTADLIMALRGGFPDGCDFCGKPYGRFVHYNIRGVTPYARREQRRAREDRA